MNRLSRGELPAVCFLCLLGALDIVKDAVEVVIEARSVLVANSPDLFNDRIFVHEFILP